MIRPVGPIEFSASVPNAFRFRGADRRRLGELMNNFRGEPGDGEAGEGALASLDRGNPTHAHARCGACDSTKHAASHDRESSSFSHDYVAPDAPKTPLDFDCPHCTSLAGEKCYDAGGGVNGGFHSLRSVLAPNPDPACTQLAGLNNKRCKAPRSEHGPDRKCPNGSGRSYLAATPRGTTSFTEVEVDLLDKIVRGALHGRSMEAAAGHDSMHSLRGKVNGLKAQVARRRAERGDS